MQGLRCSVAINRLFCDSHPLGGACLLLPLLPSAFLLSRVSDLLVTRCNRYRYTTKMATITNGIKGGVLGEPYDVHVEAEDPVYSEKKGTQSDERDMYRMGKVQQLRRNFRFFTIFGFLMVLMATWEGQLTCVLIS
jgi:hypothetical protein